MDKSLIFPCPEKAPIVREIFESIIDGLTQSEIKANLEARGIKISKNRISVMLTRIVYAGKVIVPELNDEPTVILDGIHEPIISESLFYKVQRILTLNKKNRNKEEPKYAKIRNDFHLRGVLNCSACGHVLTSSLNNS